MHEIAQNYVQVIMIYNDVSLPLSHTLYPVLQNVIFLLEGTFSLEK